MTKIEQLRADIETLEKAQADKKGVGMRHFPPGYWKDIPEWAIITELKEQLADLEAQAAAEAENTEKWQSAKRLAKAIWMIFGSQDGHQGEIARYLRHLESENTRLEAELAKRPVVLYAGNRAYTYETCKGEQK